MSWIEKLYRTYEQCSGSEPDGSVPILPVCHTTQNAHVEVTIDEQGHFRRASVVTSEQNTLIPCTEQSAGRSGKKPVNHPLCDKLQYLAGDFEKFGGSVTSGFASDPSAPFVAYLETLADWKDSESGNPKLDAIHTYVLKSRLVEDLITCGILPIDDNGMPLSEWTGTTETTPDIFKVVPKTSSPLDAFVRWRVEKSGDPQSSTWEDAALINSWISYYTTRQESKGLCNVTGNMMSMALQHPARIRHGGDKAKLVSSNDSTGYTFRGRFLTAEQASGIGFDVTQKAHNALRWLIERQAYRNGEQVFVAWTPAGKALPDAFENSSALFIDADAESSEIATEPESVPAFGGDVGQNFSIRLRKAIAGYVAKLDPNDEVIVLGLGSATPGRMAITFYREIAGSDFLQRIESWHRDFAWPQNYGKKIRFVGAPSPRDIAESAFGTRLDDKLKRATIERIIPCIVDRTPLAIDLINSCVNRACNRVGLDIWEFNKCLGIACALFKGHSMFRGKEYSMSLETENRSRDYLYGRLLAIAEHIESRALHLSGEKRDTNAARHMHRFADRPFSTWKTIELSLAPYQSRLRSNRGGVLQKLQTEMDDVMNLFKSEEFASDKKLSGEFLLAYHCQRRELWQKGRTDNDDQTPDDQN